MAVVEALRTTPGALRRAPVLLLPALLLALVRVPDVVLDVLAPALREALAPASTAGTLLGGPFVRAGLLGMADEALDDRTSLGTFVRAGRAHYVPVLVDHLVLVALGVVVGVGVVLLAAVAGLLVGATGGTATLVASAVVSTVLLALAVGYAAVVFVLQFYGQAVVVDDVGAVEGFRRSVRVVRTDLPAVVGYTVVVVLLDSLVVTAAVAGVVASIAMPALDLPVLATEHRVGLTGGLLAVRGAIRGLLAVLSVSFYRAATAPDSA